MPLGMIVVVAALLSLPSALSLPSLISMPTAGKVDLALTDSCRDDIVRNAVQAARSSDIGVTAGLLRISFHDCFPQGCDGSILLTGPNTEQDIRPQNGGLRQTALDLIESIRDKVHRACGWRSVSCTDIMNLATREAVKQSGGPDYTVPTGRLDSLEPAPRTAVEQSLPAPFFDVSQLLENFGRKGMENLDLVALSGAHTIGKASCGSFSNRFGENTAFMQALSKTCRDIPGWRQDLDVTTPNDFDNAYFVNLLQGKGLLTSDMALVNDGRTRWLVEGFAGNHWWFFGQFGTSMSKLAHMQGDQGRNGQIRDNCTRKNSGLAQDLVHAVEEFVASV